MKRTHNNPSPNRLSRRSAIGGGVAALSALVTRDGRAANGQEATPVASGVSLLFVQNFSESALDPSAGDPNNLTLTLQGDSGQTIYFADRPNRLVGIIDTAKFVDMFRAETAEDPANAALVAQVSETEETTLVIELLDLQYDKSTKTATYNIRLLDDAAELALRFRDEPRQSIDQPKRFGPSQLFIDAGGMMQLVAYGAQDIYLDESGSTGS